jgi:hypothetical protein
VLPLVPAELGQVYSQMHRKLVCDQISAEERQERQEEELKTLRMLLLLGRQGVACEQFLLGRQTGEEEQIELNRLLIHSLARRVAAGQRR